MRTTVLLLLAASVAAACDAPDRATAPDVPDASDTPATLTAPVGPDLTLVPIPTSFGYILVDISAGLPGGATDINDSGWVVGVHTVAGADHGFVRHPNGTIEDLPPLPGDARNTATGINNLNQIVGTSTASSGETHAWRRLPGHAMVRLADADCAHDAGANGIDDDGDIAGRCAGAPGEWHVDSPARWRDAGNPGELSDVAAHMMVGMVDGPGITFRASLWNGGGSPVLLTMPTGTVQSRVNGINDSHVMVGDYAVGGLRLPSGDIAITSRGGFRATPTATHTLPHAAFGISSKGRIVGWYVGIPAVAYTIAPNGGAAESVLPPGGLSRAAVRVNRCGTIVGHYFPSGLTSPAHAAMWIKSPCD